MARRFEPQAVARQIQIKTQADGNCLAWVDSGRIDQIAGNLLSNALRHTPEGGQIEIRSICQGENVEVTVHDSGPGIPPEALPHLFERFYRADRSRSRSEGGTGLGLAIARQLAEAHGGSLEASNHPQGGAIFTLRLPLEKGKNG